jgi:chorismate mutase/prephenate dehydratase
VLARLQSENAGPLSNEAVAGIFRQAMSACLALEQTLRVAYLGPPGTFRTRRREAFRRFRRHVALCDDRGVFRAAESGATDHAVVPVENSNRRGARTAARSISCPDAAHDLAAEVRLRIRPEPVCRRAASMAEVERVSFARAIPGPMAPHWLARHIAGGGPQVAVGQQRRGGPGSLPRAALGRRSPGGNASDDLTS